MKHDTSLPMGRPYGASP